MTDRQYVLRSAQFNGISVIKPKKGSPGIIAIDFNNKVNGVHPCVIDATTWAKARTQLINYYKG